MIKKNLTNLFILLGLFSASTLLAQENYVSGYIIKLNGDTLKGFVDYRNWAKSPDGIRFKVTITSDYVRYKPSEIIGFAAKDEIYKSAVVKAENSNYIEISSNPILSFRTDTAFLQTLFQGAKSLYYYKDRYDQDNFYILNNSGYELLEYKKYIKKDAAEHEFMTENKRYVGQLMVYLQDCQGIDVKLKNISYTDKKLQNLFEYYYSQQKAEAVVKRINEKIKVEFGALTGVSRVDLTFVSSDVNSSFHYLANLDFSNNISLAGGAFMNIVFPRNNGKWSLYNELFFCSDVSSYTFKDYYQYAYFEYHTIAIGGYYVKMNNMLRYKYPIGKMFIFGNLGVSNGFALAEKNQVVGVDKYNNQTAVIEKKLFDDSRKYEQGLLFGLGLIYKRYSLEFRFETGSGMSPYSALGSKAYRTDVLFGYRF
jgi:hypothetical protein